MTVSPPGSDPRSFPAEFFVRTWATSRYRCYYAGNAQGGEWGLLPGTDDSVIEGSYSDYRVDSIFAVDFDYNRFDSERCTSGGYGGGK